LQICTPSYVKEYKFAHQGGILQFCTPNRGLQFCTPSQKIIKILYLHRGFQICIPLQRISNLILFVDRCTQDHWHEIPLQLSIENRAGQNVAVYCDNYSREPVIGTCTLARMLKSLGWRTLRQQAGNLGRGARETLIFAAIDHVRSFHYSFQPCIYLH